MLVGFLHLLLSDSSFLWACLSCACHHVNKEVLRYLCENCSNTIVLLFADNLAMTSLTQLVGLFKYLNGTDEYTQLRTMHNFEKIAPCGTSLPPPPPSNTGGMTSA